MAGNSPGAPVKVLPVSCMTSQGAPFLARFPLHDLTRSPDHVGKLSDALLATVTAFVQGDEEVGNGDVLQAMAIALAIRARVIEAPLETTQSLTRGLVDTALDAVADAKPVASGRA